MGTRLSGMQPSVESRGKHKGYSTTHSLLTLKPTYRSVLASLTAELLLRSPSLEDTLSCCQTPDTGHVLLGKGVGAGGLNV